MACLSLVVTRRKGGSRIYGNHQPPPWEKEDHQYRSSSHRQPTSKPLNPTLYTPCLPVPANRTRPNVTTLFPNFWSRRNQGVQGQQERRKKEKTNTKIPHASDIPCAMPCDQTQTPPCPCSPSVPCTPVLPMQWWVFRPNTVQIHPHPKHQTMPKKEKKSSNASRESSPFFCCSPRASVSITAALVGGANFSPRDGRMGGWRVVCFCE